jgi:prophage regulatory protein
MNELLEPPANTIRFIRLPDVKHLTGLGKTAIYKRIGEGSFPGPIKLGGSAVGWIEAEVSQWCLDRIAESRSTALSMPRPIARQGGQPSPASSFVAA